MPLRFESGEAAVVIVDPIAAPLVSSDSALQVLVAYCRGLVAMTPEDSAYAVQHRNRDVERTIESTERWIVSFIVLGRDPSPALCPDHEAQDLIAPTRGLMFSAAMATELARRPTRALLMRGERAIEGTDTLRGPTLRFTPGGANREAGGLFRVAVGLDSLAPQADGTLDDFWLAVWFGADRAPTRVPIPASILARLWERATVPRILAASEAELDASVVQFAPLVPEDEYLRHSFREYVLGDPRYAAGLAARRLEDTVVTGADLRSVRVQYALTALALGDTAVSRIAFRTVARDAPCFTLATDAPPVARELVAALDRPPPDCATTPHAIILMRGIVLPGFGRATSPERVALGALTMAVVIGSYKVSRASFHDADATYRDSYGHGGAVEASAAFRRWRRERAVARHQRQFGTMVWIASLVEALAAEGLHRHRLHQIQQYGRLRSERRNLSRLDIAPAIGLGAYGVSIAFD